MKYVTMQLSIANMTHFLDIYVICNKEFTNLDQPIYDKELSQTNVIHSKMI